MNVGSLFAGIGGFDLGFERAGMRTLWQVEQDSYRRAVLARHFPDAERYEDVREVGARNLEWVDLICGGFPCTDLSIAGEGAGLDGAASGLWSEYARVVGELRPRYVVVENVPDLLVRGRRWDRAPVGRVLGDLAAFGYDAEWDCVPASAVGAPHRRDRIWLVAYPQREGLEGHGAEPRPSQVSESGNGRALADPARDGKARAASSSGSERERTRTRRESGRGDVADAEGESQRAGLRTDESAGVRGGRSSNGGSQRAAYEGRSVDDTLRGRHEPPQGEVSAGRDGSIDAGWWSLEPDVGRVAHGIPARVDRLAALGDSLVPQIAEWIGRRLMEREAA